MAVFAGDTDGCLINHPDRDLTCRVVASGTDDTIVDGQLARRLPGLLLEAGLGAVEAQAFTTLDRDPRGFYAERCERWAATATQAGAVTNHERDRWVATLHAEQDAGRFLVAQIQLLAWRSPKCGPAQRRGATYSVYTTVGSSWPGRQKMKRHLWATIGRVPAFQTQHPAALDRNRRGAA